jgi:hypothetical protein
MQDMAFIQLSLRDFGNSEFTPALNAGLLSSRRSATTKRSLPRSSTPK